MLTTGQNVLVAFRRSDLADIFSDWPLHVAATHTMRSRFQESYKKHNVVWCAGGQRDDQPDLQKP